MSVLQIFMDICAIWNTNFKSRSYKDIMNCRVQIKKKLKCQTNERYFSLTSQEAVKKKYHFPQRVAITLMNAQHVNLLAKRKKASYFLTKCSEQNLVDDKKQEEGQNGLIAGALFIVIFQHDKYIQFSFKNASTFQTHLFFSNCLKKYLYYQLY